MCNHFNMEDGRRYATFLACLLYDIKKGKNASKTHTQRISAVNGESAVTDCNCQKWFAKCHVGDFSLADAPWTLQGQVDQLS